MKRLAFLLLLVLIGSLVSPLTQVVLAAPAISWTTMPSSGTTKYVKVGETFSLSFYAEDTGDPSPSGYVTVVTNSPDLEITQATSSASSSIQIHYPGDNVHYANGDYKPYNAYLVDAHEDLYSGDKIGTDVTFKATKSGTYYIYWRAAFSKDAEETSWVRSPTSGTRDPLGYYAYYIKIVVEEPEPQISWTTMPSSGSTKTVKVGEEFTLSFYAKDTGDPSPSAYVTVLTDSPNLQIIGKSSSVGSNLFLFKPGDSVHYADGSTKPYNGYLLDAQKPLSTGETTGADVTFKATQPGTYYIYWRAAFSRNSDETSWIRSPSYGTKDPLGYYAYYMKIIAEESEIDLTINVHNVPGLKLPSAGGKITLQIYDSSNTKVKELTKEFSGGEDYLSFTFSVTPRDYYLRVYQTAPDNLPEYWGRMDLGYVSNSQTFNFYRNTLYLSKFIIEPNNPNVGDTVTIKAEIVNPSNQDLRGGIASIYVDRDKQSPYDFSKGIVYDTIPAGGSKIITLGSFTVTEPGKYYVKYEVATQTTESDIGTTITDHGLGWGELFTATSNYPDLKVISVKLYKNGQEISEAYPGDQIEVKVTVKNLGNASSSSTSVGLYLSKIPYDHSSSDFIDDVSVPGLSPSQETTVTKTITIPDKSPDEYYLNAYVDYKEQITESEERNNIGYAQVTIKERSYVWIDSIWLPEIKEVYGTYIFAKKEPIPLLVNLTTTTSDPFTVKVYIDSTMLQEMSGSYYSGAHVRLVFKGTYTIVVPSEITEGDHFLIIKLIDKDNKLLEEHKLPLKVQNTFDKEKIYISDYSVEVINGSLDNVHIGDRVKVTLKIQNDNPFTTVYVDRVLIYIQGPRKDAYLLYWYYIPEQEFLILQPGKNIINFVITIPEKYWNVDPSEGDPIVGGLHIVVPRLDGIDGYSILPKSLTNPPGRTLRDISFIVDTGESYIEILGNNTKIIHVHLTQRYLDVYKDYQALSTATQNVKMIKDLLTAIKLEYDISYLNQKYGSMDQALFEIFKKDPKKMTPEEWEELWEAFTESTDTLWGSVTYVGEHVTGQPTPDTGGYDITFIPWPANLIVKGYETNPRYAIEEAGKDIFFTLFGLGETTVFAILTGGTSLGLSTLIDTGFMTWDFALYSPQSFAFDKPLISKHLFNCTDSYFSLDGVLKISNVHGYSPELKMGYGIVLEDPILNKTTTFLATNDNKISFKITGIRYTNTDDILGIGGHVYLVDMNTQKEYTIGKFGYAQKGWDYRVKTVTIPVKNIPPGDYRIKIQLTYGWLSSGWDYYDYKTLDGMIASDYLPFESSTTENKVIENMIIHIDTPPTVSFISPVPSQHITQGDTLQIEVNATDAEGVSYVELYLDGNLIKNWTSGPYTHTLNTQSLSVGQHTLKAVAVDTAGQESETSLTFYVDQPEIDNPPTIEITNKAELTSKVFVMGETILVTVSAGDDKGITKIEYLVNGHVIDTHTFNGETTKSDGKLIPQSSLVIGENIITVRVYDTSGQTEEDQVTIQVKADEPPTISIPFPPNHSRFTRGQEIPLSFKVSDDAGVSRIEIWLDQYGGTSLDSLSSINQKEYTYQQLINSTTWKRGRHKIIIITTDTSGQETFAELNLNIEPCIRDYKDISNTSGAIYITFKNYQSMDYAVSVPYLTQTLYGRAPKFKFAEGFVSQLNATTEEDVIITIGGPLVNSVTRYYGNLSYVYMNLSNIPNNITIVTPHRNLTWNVPRIWWNVTEGYFIIQILNEPYTGALIVTIYGTDMDSTAAGAYYFSHYIYPNLNKYIGIGYLVGLWQDTQPGADYELPGKDKGDTSGFSSGDTISIVDQG